MELIIDVLNYDHALYCIDQNVQNIILSNELYSSQYNYSFNEQEIQFLINNKKNTKIWIKVDAFFYEQDINRLICYLRWLSRLNIDYIIFQDFAVFQINEEYNLNLKLHYGSQTLNVSSFQFNFFKENNINSLFLAREISFVELKDICANKNDMKVEIHGHGYSYMMHSRWKMISNFNEYYETKINKDNNVVRIKEELRKYPDIIFENKHGTHMYTGYMLYSIDLIDKLIEIGIDYLRLDFINTNIEYAKSITSFYLKKLKNNLNKDDFEQFLDLHTKNNLNISHGFLGEISKLPGLIKDDNDE